MRKLLVLATILSSLIPMSLFAIFKFGNWGLWISVSIAWLVLLGVTIQVNKASKRIMFLLLLIPLGFAPIGMVILFFINLVLQGFRP